MLKQVTFGLTFLLCLLVTTTTEVFHWAAYLAVAMCGLVLAFAKWNERSQVRWSSVCLGSTLVFAGYCLWRAQVSSVTDLGRKDLFMILYATAVYVMVWSVGVNPRMFLWVVGAVAGANVALILLQNGGYEKVSLYSWLGYDRVGHLQRPSGLFFNANHAAAFLGFAVLLITSQLVFRSMSVQMRLLGAFFVLFCLLAVFLTKSRSGAVMILGGLGMIGGVALMGVFRDSRFRTGIKISALVLAMVSILAVGVLSWGVVQSRGAGTGGIFEGEARGALWESALNQWKKNPLIGTGAGSYDYYEMRERPNRPRSLAVTRGVYVHNDWLQLLAEYGAVAVALAFVMLGYHLMALFFRIRMAKREWGAAWSKGTYSAFALGVGVASFGLLVQGGAEFHLRLPAILCCLMVCLGFIGRGSNKPGAELGWNRWLIRVPILLLSVGLAFAAYRYGVSDVASAVAKKRLSSGDAVAALNVAKYASDWDPSSATAYGVVGRCYMELGNETKFEMVKRSFFKKAVEVYGEALERYPQSIEYLLVLTRLHARLGDVDKGLAVWQRAFEWAPLWNDTHLARVDALVYGDRRQEALDACDEWYSLNTSGVAKQVQFNLKRDFATLPLKPEY